MTSIRRAYSLHVLQGFEYLQPEIMQQLANGWLGAPCQELLAYMQEACFLVISTSTPTEYLLQLCDTQDVTFEQLLAEMQQVEFSFLGVNQRQPGRQFVLIRHKHVDPAVVDYCLEHYMPCLPAEGVQHTFQTPPQAWAAHLQQLKAPPADTDVTARHSKLGSSVIADIVAKAQSGSSPSSPAELVQEGQQQQQQQSHSATTAEVKAATSSLGNFSTLSPPTDTSTAQIDTSTKQSVPAPLPKAGQVSMHKSALDPRPSVSTAEAKAAGTKSLDAKAAEVKAAEAKAAEAKAAEVKAAAAKAKAKASPAEQCCSSSSNASTRPTSEQGMPNISSK